MQAASPSEKPVTIYQSVRRHIPDDSEFINPKYHKGTHAESMTKNTTSYSPLNPYLCAAVSFNSDLKLINHVDPS